MIRIQHVALPFPGTPESVTAARRFYGEGVGLEERPVPPSLPGVVWFAVGDQELHLFSEPTGVAVNSESRRHPCFEVEGLAAMRARLADAGIHTIDAEGDIPGRRRFFVLDPFGNALEFIQLEPSA